MPSALRNQTDVRIEEVLLHLIRDSVITSYVCDVLYTIDDMSRGNIGDRYLFMPRGYGCGIDSLNLTSLEERYKAYRKNVDEGKQEAYAPMHISHPLGWAFAYYKTQGNIQASYFVCVKEKEEWPLGYEFHKGDVEVVPTYEFLKTWLTEVTEGRMR